MQNWPKSKRTIWQSLRIQATRKIFQLVSRIENPKLKILKSLKVLSLHELYPQDFDLIACPDTVNVELERVGFSDLFFPEEFENLQQGLNKLLSQGNYMSLGGSKEDLNEWFSNIKNSTFEGASTFYVGAISFANKGTKKNLKFLRNAQIWLKHIDSSFITLSIFIEPSDRFMKDFNSIIRSIPIPQSEILGINFKHSFPSLLTSSSWLTRESELERLFLELNKNIVILFRETFNAGLSRFGPLPYVEVLSTNVALKEIPFRVSGRKHSKEFRACSRFFHSLGYPSREDRIYKDENWWSLYEISRDKIFYKNFHSYQALISSVDYEKVNMSGGDKESLIAFTLSKLNEFLYLLALENFYEVLRSLTIGIKNELEPTLNSQIQGKIKIKNLGSGTAKMIILNSLHFNHSRIWIGVDSEFFSYIMNREIRTLCRRQNGKEDLVLLADDIKFNIENNKRFCEQQLSLLRLAYSQILSYKSTSLNYLLQFNTLVLSFVVALLTIITVIPEDTRITLAIGVWKWFLSLF